MRSVCESRSHTPGSRPPPSPADHGAAMYRSRTWSGAGSTPCSLSAASPGSRTSAAASVRAGRVGSAATAGGRRSPASSCPTTLELLVDGEPALRLPRRAQARARPRRPRIDVDGRSCLDVGASTGGFTDCLLQTRRRAGDRHRRRATGSSTGRFATTHASRCSSAPMPGTWRRTSFRTCPTLRRSTSPSSRWPRSCPPSRRVWRWGELLAWSSPSSSSGGPGPGRRGALPDERREALLSVATRPQWTSASHSADLRSSGLPGPKGNRETFVWCAADGPGERDVESAAREVEP